MKKPLRALVLAAGLGTRLRPLTNKTPKCLVSIGGQPLLGRWLHQLESLGCEAVLINTHYLANQVDTFVASWENKKMNIQTTYEPDLLGTARTLMVNREYFAGATGLLIHADNLTNADLHSFIDAHYHRNKDCLLTMLTFHSMDPTSCGIVETDSKGVVMAFHEKVKHPPGTCANGAVYLFENSFLDWFDQLGSGVIDFSKDVLPNLLGRIQTWHTKSTFIDIGTPEAFQKAQMLMSSDGFNK